MKKVFIDNFDPDIRSKLETKFDEIIKLLRLNEVVDNVHLEETPKRLSKMFVTELFEGCFNAPPLIKTFVDKNVTPVISTNISIKSVCAHHFVPFLGKASIYYTPKDGIITGLSKFSRIADYFSRRPQIQENLTRQIGEYLVEHLQPKDLIIAIKAQHMCMSLRGVNEDTPLTETYYAYDITGVENFEKIRYVMDSIKL